jgi:hypothetical protein
LAELTSIQWQYSIVTTAALVGVLLLPMLPLLRVWYLNPHDGARQVTFADEPHMHLR